MALELVSVDEVMLAMAVHPELAEISALLQGESVRRAVGMIEQLGFVVARQETTDLSRLSDDDLLIGAALAIRLAAQGEANGGDNDTYVRAMQFKVESDKRLVANGHDKRCHSGIYSQAYEAATAAHENRQPAEVLCTCQVGNASA
jgi:hypothetical protein